MTTARRLLLALLLPALAACAGSPAAPPPTSQFPFRSSDQRPFSVYWQLAEVPGSVNANGVLDVGTYVDRLADATVELVGLDAQGRVVSRGADRVTPRSFSGDTSWPFRVRLTPTGGETRYAVRIAEFNWKVEPMAGK
jgi:hypothetical protein